MLPCGNLFVGFLRLGGFRQLQLEHALGKGCLDLVRVHSFRQLESRWKNRNAVPKDNSLSRVLPSPRSWGDEWGSVILPR
jgi:hypothetical protein